MEDLYLDGMSNSNREKQTRNSVIGVIVFAVLLGAAIAAYQAFEARYEEGYAAGFETACTEVRESLATGMSAERLFLIPGVNAAFQRVGDHTFVISSTDVRPKNGDGDGRNQVADLLAVRAESTKK